MLVETILSGLAIGAALIFGLFLVGGGVLPSAPLTAFALLFGVFLAWDPGTAPRATAGGVAA